MEYVLQTTNLTKRYGSAPALSHYAKEIAGYDPLCGLYAYGGVGGEKCP